MKSSYPTHLTYDRFGNVCQEDLYDGSGQYLHTITRAFNERGSLLLETNALGETTTYQYTMSLGNASLDAVQNAEQNIPMMPRDYR